MSLRPLLPFVLCLLPACGGESPAHHFSSDVEACKANLRDLYDGLTSYQLEYKRLPEEPGVAFFAELISSGYWENTEANARKLTCPGVDIAKLALAGKPPESWFKDLATVGGESSSYAGRDTKKFPLYNVPGPGEALIACDNRHGANHDGVTNVLMSDGSILSLELETEIELGNLPEGTTELVVGPDSLIPELQTLSLD